MSRSLIPMLFESFPSQVDDLLDVFHPTAFNPYWMARNLPGGHQHRRQHGHQHQQTPSLFDGTVCTADNFTVNLDVQHFKPEEITVKVVGDNVISIEAKHEEKADEHGHIYRHFVRKYTVPEGYDLAHIVSKLSSDRQLTICAPKVTADAVPERVLHIQHTGVPAVTDQKKKPEEKIEA